jgi:hypothetical protein
MRWVRIALILAIGWGVFHFVIAPPAGVVATEIVEVYPLPLSPVPSLDKPPRQDTLDGQRRLEVEGLDFSVVPRANFELKARVLSSKHYRLGREARLSPVDLALGWGPMAEDAVVGSLDISQRNRWYYWRTESLPIPPQEISLNSSNMHMMAGNAAILGSLKRLQAGDLVTLRGHLVDVEGDRWRWRTSTSRTDTGKGACEIVLVQSLLVH